jgi:hypothetical protein
VAVPSEAAFPARDVAGDSGVDVEPRDVSSPLAKNILSVVATGAPVVTSTGMVTGWGDAVDSPAVVGVEIDAVDAPAAAVETPAVTCWGDVTPPRACTALFSLYLLARS